MLQDALVTACYELTDIECLTDNAEELIEIESLGKKKDDLKLNPQVS